ncbi:MAG: MOSC domain-containing protein [Rhodobacteraceae bacterium]|nr:MOSC domain-containing protein [Paracoccaceae bacterium]
MPALKPTSFSAHITWLGYVPDRAASLRSTPLNEAFIGFGGIEGEDHGGLTRLSCGRVTALYPRNTTIRNTRQLSVVSAEDLPIVAKTMGIDAIDPADIGASIVLEGLANVTHLPPSSRLQAPGGATIVVDMENRPCTLPAPYLDEANPGKGALFRAAAKGRRGVTAWVEREGLLKLGDEMRLFIPDQPAWPPLAETRL